ncbi:MAG: hypothetical protein AAGM67_06595 [Bacteroidota bacterium]
MVHDAITGRIVLEVNFEGSHEHDLHDDCSVHVPVWARNEIWSLVERDFRFNKRSLLQQLRNAPNADEEFIVQKGDLLYRYYKKRRQSVGANLRSKDKSMVLEELVNFAKNKYYCPSVADFEDNSQASQKNPNELFVLGSFFEASTGRVSLVISTIQLLKNMKRQTACGIGSFVQTDATYKLNWSRLPLLVLGTSDIAHQFHLVALCLSSHEDSAAYEFLFRTVFDSALGTSISQIPNGLSDSSDAIRKGARDAFGSQTVWMNCYAHLVRNLFSKKKALYSSAARMKEFKDDVGALHAITSRAIFKTFLTKFVDKWRELEPDACSVLRKEYGSGWASNFEGAAGIPGPPSSNKGLEGRNRWIKEHGTEGQACIHSTRITLHGDKQSLRSAVSILVQFPD